MIDDRKLDTYKTVFLIGFKDHPMIKSEGVAINKRMNIKF